MRDLFIAFSGRPIERPASAVRGLQLATGLFCDWGQRTAIQSSLPSQNVMVIRRGGTSCAIVWISLLRRGITGQNDDTDCDPGNSRPISGT
jgi:hypothetical protein